MYEHNFSLSVKTYGLISKAQKETLHDLGFSWSAKIEQKNK